ncbi:MAG: 14.7 kDa ribonuclease H-like protein [Syntrophaceae bacterium PtaB.Bin038]|nr:MAG: 14.7 kDa ribonuclease H-like protein [Syntrophaceae bacterium PtaB.Bin038]
MANNTLTLFTDGACRGNPGQGGAGVVLMTADGQVVSTAKKYLGRCTNNIAEYRALILGLEEALARKPDRLRVYLDSELLVRQIQGVYRVKNPALQPLMTEVRSLLARFGVWEVDHVPRRENALADALANEAIDEALGKNGR